MQNGAFINALIDAHCAGMPDCRGEGKKRKVSGKRTFGSRTGLSETADARVGDQAMMGEVGEETKHEELEEQMTAATEMVEEVVRRMLHQGKIHPQIIVLAVARVAGGVTAAAALAGGEDVEKMLSDVTEVVHQAGRAYYDGLRAEMMPVAGNA